MTEGNHEKKHKQFGQHRDLNAELPEYETSVMNLYRRYALCIQKLIINRTSQSAKARIRASNFNRCNDAPVSTREVPLVHASLLYHVHAVVSRNKWFISCGTSEKLTLWTSSYKELYVSYI